jgi:hypothetical protein
LGIPSGYTKAAIAGSYQTRTRPSLRQLWPIDQPPSISSASSLGRSARLALNATYSETLSQPKSSTTASFIPTQSADSSTSSALYKGKLLRPESSHPKPFVPYSRKFDEFAAGENVETQESRRLAIPGAFPDMTLHTTMPSELDSKFEQTIIFKVTQRVKTTFDFAAAQMQRIGRYLRHSRGNQGQGVRQGSLAVIQTCRAAVGVVGSCKRRMTEYIGSRYNSTQSPDAPATNSLDNRNVLCQGNQNNQTGSVEYPVLNNEVESNASPIHGSQLRDEERQETSTNAKTINTQPRSRQAPAPSLSFAQARAIQEVLQSHYDIKIEDAVRGDINKRRPINESKAEKYSENENARLASTVEHVTQNVETSQHSSSSKDATIYTQGLTKDSLQHIDDTSFSAPSKAANIKLEEDENLEELLEDNFSPNHGLNHRFAQTEDVDSSSSTAPVNKANRKLGEGERIEGLLNDDSGPNDGLNHAIEQTGDAALHLLDGVAKVHISDRRRSTRQVEKEAAEQRAEALKREKAEAAAQAEREARLAEAARIAQEKANVEARWLKSMGRSALPRGCSILKPVARDWAQKVRDAMTRPLNAELATVSNGTKLTRRDFSTILEQPYWLNDEVIAAYIQLSVDHALERTGHTRGQTPKIHAFNSFFYKNLSTKGPASIARWAGRAKIGGKDLKRVDTIFIPVNPGVHWTLLVVSPSKRSIEYFDSLSGSRPSPTNNVYTDNVKKWLKQEMGTEYNDAEWTVRIRNDGPQQNNGYDCGVFAITTAKLIALGYDPVGAYDASVMPAQRIRLVAELMARDWVESEEDRRGGEIDTEPGVDDDDEDNEEEEGW